MAEKQKAEKKPTERTVLAEVKLPRDQVVTGLPDAVADKIVRGETVKVYVQVGGTATGSKAKAVEEMVGETPGVFRAPSTSSWHGAVDQGEEVIPEQKKFRRRRVD